MGLALHEPLESVGLHSVLAEFQIDVTNVRDGRVLRGGPVDPSRGAVLHDRSWMTEQSVPLPGDFALTSSMDVLRAIAGGEGPKRFELFLGYAGWADGQLEAELASPGWLLGTSDPSALFALAPERRWAAALQAEGVNPAMLTPSSGHA